MVRWLFVFLAFVLFPLYTRADTPPLPPRKVSLETLQSQLEKERSSQITLENRLGKAQEELETTRRDLVKLAENLQANEAELDRLEQNIDRLSKEEAELTARLEQDYGSIADLILALERIRRVPPESLIVRPGAPLQTAQSAMLLKATLPAVHRRAGLLSLQLGRLQNISHALKNDRTAALESRKTLESRQVEISSLVSKRERLFGEIQTDYEQNKRTVERLSREAKTLLDLIDKLEKEEKRQAASSRDRPVQVAYSNKMPEPGKPRTPVPGVITVNYGGIDAIGAKSQGISIEARPRALVVAPMNGIVRFAGAFKNYGNLVIIEHGNGYHSLIAGLYRIDAPLEARINTGEPVGQLPLTSSRGGRPALYYELRLNGQPVDPAGMFSDLKS